MDEQWLWQLVDEGDRIREQAPTAATPEEIGAARRAVAAANATVHRVEAQVEAVESALAQPWSWLRPTHRHALVGSLRRGRAAIVAATTTRDAADRAYQAMERAGHATAHLPRHTSGSAGVGRGGARRTRSADRHDH